MTDNTKHEVPAAGKFRAWIIIDPPSSPKYITVETLAEVMVIFQTLCGLTEYLEGEANVSGLEYFDTEIGEYCEWYDSEGDDIEKYWDKYTDNVNSMPEEFYQKLYDPNRGEECTD